MGIDIEMYAEKRVNNKWQKIGDVFLDGWNNTYSDHPYVNRNYNLFDILSGEEHNSIFKSKGLPEDISDEVNKDLGYEIYCEYSWSNYFGHSWLTLKELKEYDWEQQTVKKSCRDFYEDTIPTLEKQIPDGGTDEDVRILFAFY